MRAWILIAAIALAGCPSKRSVNQPGSNTGSNGQPDPGGAVWSSGAPALTGP